MRAIYQVYPRSFADANGDGTGDLAGVRARLGYLHALGIDAIWFTPWYPSPMADGGYDVADYRAIDPLFGDLDEAEHLIRDALALGIRTIIDVGPEPRLRPARLVPGGAGRRPRARPSASGSGSATDSASTARSPPTGWESEFGGPTWSRVIGPDGTPEQWYLHLFAPGSPT